MKELILLLLVINSLLCFSQNKQPIEFGIGFAVASDPYKFENGSHYNNIFIDKDLGIKFQNGVNRKVFPFFYKPDYGLYHFICLEKSVKYYKILINDLTVGYIPNDSNFYFITWESVLLSSTIERLTKDNPIQKSSLTDNKTIQNNCNPDRLKAESVIEKNNEYWLYVSFSPSCEEYPSDKSTLNYGWIKWRTKNKLLVEILLLC